MLRDRDLLLIPYCSEAASVVQWPLFLLLNKVLSLYRLIVNYDLYKVNYAHQIRSCISLLSFFFSIIFLSQISKAIELAKSFKGMEEDKLLRKIKSDDYMYSAVMECYETLTNLICDLLEDEADKM